MIEFHLLALRTQNLHDSVHAYGSYDLSSDSVHENDGLVQTILVMRSFLTDFRPFPGFIKILLFYFDSQITIPAEDRRDDEQLYHKYKLKHLMKMAPFIDWISYFNFAFSQINHTITEDEPIVVYSPAYLSNISVLIQEYNSSSEGRTWVYSLSLSLSSSTASFGSKLRFFTLFFSLNSENHPTPIPSPAIRLPVNKNIAFLSFFFSGYN